LYSVLRGARNTHIGAFRPSQVPRTFRLGGQSLFAFEQVHIMQVRHFLVLLATSALTPALRAQDPIATDRPGITFTPNVVGEGVFQIEAGVPQATFTRGMGTDTELWSFPVQLRYGLTPALELRLGSPTWNMLEDDTSGDSVDGFGDVEIGAKLQLSDGTTGPKTAIIAGVRAPVGDDEFTSHQPGYSLSFAALWSLSDTEWLQGLAGATMTPVGDEDSITGNLALLLGHSFAGTPWSAYVEAGYFPEIEEAVDTAVAGAGVAYLVSNDVQLDVFGDFGLNEDTPDAVVGFGISWRP
jgi:hypothetical protein